MNLKRRESRRLENNCKLLAYASLSARSQCTHGLYSDVNVQVTNNADGPGLHRYAGAIDCVGGSSLVAALACIEYGGAVAACGLAGGHEMRGASVMPFILRGVNLLGVDSVMAENEKRLVFFALAKLWSRMIICFRCSLC